MFLYFTHYVFTARGGPFLSISEI